jgi:hypothetical protein
MNPEDLSAAARDLPRLMLGTLLFLMPGLAAADRLFPRNRAALLLAPVFSFTLLPLAAILLRFALGVPVNEATTVLTALGLTLIVGGGRIGRALDPERLGVRWRPVARPQAEAGGHAEGPSAGAPDEGQERGPAA